MKLKKIINKIEIIKSGHFTRYFKNIEKYDYYKFVNKLKNEDFILDIITKITNGTVIVLSDTLEPEFIENAKIKLNNYSSDREQINPKIIDGAKNGYYLSKNLSGNGYKTFDRSFYFFAWNKDDLNIYNKIYKLYQPLKILNGLSFTDYQNNIPSDGLIERLHVIHYPPGGGLISKHYDPINVSIVNFGLYGTQYGIDYSDGGFYVFSNNETKVNIDKDIKKTDIVLFFPGMIHGVDPVLVKHQLNLNSNSGRWFFNINIIESHHIKNRQYTQALN